MSDMGSHMKFYGRQDLKCECCGVSKWNAPTYIWRTIITDKKLKVCKSCALREAFGSKYKQNKQYLQWREREENGE